MSIEEAIFVTLVIVGIFATILAAAALLADFMFHVHQRQARPSHRNQATYRRAK
jgi:hypothetical protein